MATSESVNRQEILGRVPAFAGLGDRELGQLAEVAHTRHLKPREELCHKGDEGSQVYVIVSGRLRVVATSEDGSDVQFNIMNPGEVCGELALFAGGERTATMAALEECEVLSLDRRDFLPFLRKNPDVAVHMLEVLAERMRHLSELVEDNIFLGLPARLAKRLVALADQYGNATEDGVEIDLRLSQQELGTMVGTSRESVNKQMRSWEDARIVRSERGRITILRLRELESLAGLAGP